MLVTLGLQYQCENVLSLLSFELVKFRHVHKRIMVHRTPTKYAQLYRSTRYSIQTCMLFHLELQVGIEWTDLMFTL